MKTLVVYYSRSGTTKKVAEAIANAFKCDIEEIIDKKKRKGLLGLFMAGHDATLGNLTKIKDMTRDISLYDLVIIGGPIWSWSVCPAVRTFLLHYMDQIKSIAFFCTEGGGGGENAFNTMEKISGKIPIAKLILKWADIRKNDYLKKVSNFIDSIRAGS